MKKLSLVLALAALAVGLSGAAKAAPAYVGFGLGGYNFTREDDGRKAVDFRLEYQAGMSLLPKLSSNLTSLDSLVQVHPTFGLEVNSKGAVYGSAGLNADFTFFKHAVFTWGESVGGYSRGNDAAWLGSVLEFRSQIELGWQFANDWRASAYLSHISNGSIVGDDPGAEILGVYLRVPLTAFKMP